MVLKISLILCLLQCSSLVKGSALSGDAVVAHCLPVPRNFVLHLSAPLQKYERIGLTGDSKALGEWQLERSIPLIQQDEIKWFVTVTLQSCRDTSYRYFIYVEDEQGNKQIRRWETQFQSRKLNSQQNCDILQNDIFGRIVPDAEPQIKRGWLTNESIVQLKFEREKLFQIFDVNAFDAQNFVVKLELQKGDILVEEPESGVNIEVSKFAYGLSHLQAQQPQGVTYKKGDVVIFHLTLPQPITHMFVLNFYSEDSKSMGKALIKPEMLKSSGGTLELDVLAPQKVAHLSLPYVVIKPYTQTSLNFRTTYAHSWPKSWPNLDVGHRGNGRSYIADAPTERENTLSSFQRAYECNGDMIELDVHLTADSIPIIYHDFGVKTAAIGKQITSTDQLEYVLIKDLTYEAVKNLRVFAIINNEPVEYTSHNDEPNPKNRIFPTLQDVLENLPNSLGIDVEIKWPQLKVTGSLEADQSIDKNFFVDTIISKILTHGCGRPLIFSSFDADLCAMLRFKQNLLPVMYLSQGETKKWTAFADLRTRNFAQAINNAQAFELLGTAPHAEDFLNQSKGKEMISKSKNLGQIAVVWGDDCNSKERVLYFNELGFTATCYDRTDLNIKEKERAFFNATTMLKEFENQCNKK